MASKDLLAYVQYSLHQVEPYKLRPDIEEIATFEIPRLSELKLEKDYLASYESMERREAEEEEKDISDNASLPVAANVTVSSSSSSQRSVQVATHVYPEAESSSKNGKYLSAENSPSPMVINLLIDDMMSHTAREASREVCQFYLESADWNLDKAVAMYRSMKE